MNINSHPIFKALYDLCLEIEKLPASEQQTKVSIMASALEKPIGYILESSVESVGISLVAGELYEVYCKAVGGMAFNGEPLPSWDAFSKDQSKSKQSDAWKAVAVEALKISIK